MRAMNFTGKPKKKKKVSKRKSWHWPYLRTNIGGAKEYMCEHGVGHGGIHSCCEFCCCNDPLFPGNSKPIVGYENNYIATQDGKIYSLKYGQPRLMKTHEKDGYLWVQLQKPRIYKSVHRLIAETFIPNPENKRVVNHKDFNRKHNSIDNLEWVTDSENQLWTYKHGHRENPLQKLAQRNRDNSKIKDDNELFNLYEQGFTYVQIAKKLNVHRETVARHIRRIKKRIK